jgi:hypothetical protein
MRINRFFFTAGSVGRILMIGAISLGASASVGAFEITQEAREACTPDAFRLCQNEIPDVPKVTACMEANKKNLSPACRAVFDSMTAQADKPVIHHRRHYRETAEASRHHKHHRYSRAWHHREASLR